MATRARDCFVLRRFVGDFERTRCFAGDASRFLDRATSLPIYVRFVEIVIGSQRLVNLEKKNHRTIFSFPSIISLARIRVPRGQYRRR